jgi:hypothetical protein
MSGICAPFQAFVERQLLKELSPNRRASYGWYSFAFVLIIGTHWMIIPVNIAVFFELCGKENEPIATSLIPLVLLPVLFVYNMLVSLIKDARILVTFIGVIYASIYFIIGFQLLATTPDPIWGWLLFFATDTKATLFPVMLWSVVNEVSSPDNSKKAYPVIAFACQLGSIGGSGATILVDYLGGTAGLLIGQGISICLVMISACVPALLPALQTRKRGRLLHNWSWSPREERKP